MLAWKPILKAIIAIYFKVRENVVRFVSLGRIWLDDRGNRQY